MKRIWIITLFPDYFVPLKECGVVGKAFRGERGSSFELNVLQLRDYSPKDFKGVDDAPYGGGHGQVMRVDVLKNALDAVVSQGNYQSIKDDLHVVFTSPRGRKWDNHYVKEFSHRLSEDEHKDLVFVCGRYEGIDERFIDLYVNEIISLGDFILSGGELAVLTILDSAMRFCPDVLGNKQSAVDESFAHGLLENPYYTRPAEFDGVNVPDVLLGGHHEKQESWKQQKRIELTKKYRPDLYEIWLKENS